MEALPTEDGKPDIYDSLLVPEDLIVGIRAHLGKLDIRFNEEVAADAHIDGGGMVKVGQPRVTVLLRGLELSTYTSHVSFMHEALKKVELATEDIGVEYFVLPCFCRRLLMTAAIRDELIALLAPHVAEAEALMSLEDAEWGKPLKEAVYRAPRGKPIKAEA